MFKLLTCVLFAVAIHNSSARPQEAEKKPTATIISETKSIDGAGNFNYAFETSDGIKEEAKGSLKTLKVPVVDPATGQTTGEQDGTGIVQEGKYSYTAPDGQLIEVTYIADENGFQPQGKSKFTNQLNLLIK